MRPRPQLHQAHEGGEAGVNVSKVAQHCGLEPGCSTRHTDITLNACATAPALQACHVQ